MASEPINIPIKTTYDDSGASDAIDDAEKLENLEPTVTIEADSTEAKSEIGDVEQVAQELIDRNPWIAEVLADTATAKSELEGLQTKLRETGDKADDTTRHMDGIGKSSGPGIGTQSISDMLGPLGDASGAASEFGQSVEGIGAIVETAAAKVGLNSAAMSTAIGGIGVAVGLAAAAWTFFKQKQEEAKKKAAEHLKIQGEIVDAIKDGNREVAASKFVELYGDIIDKGVEAGLSINEVVDAIRGTGDAAATAQTKVDDLDRQISELDKAYQDLHSTTAASGAVPSGEEKALADQLVSLRNSRDALIESTTEWANMTAEQQANVDKQNAVQTALLGTETDTDKVAAAADRAKQKTDDLSAAFDILTGSLDFERTMEDFETDINTAMNNVALGVAPTKEEIRTIEDTIIEVGEMAGKNPIQVKSELEKISNGDLFSVLNTAQSWANEHKIQVQFEAASDAQSKIRSAFAKFGITVPVTPGLDRSATAAAPQTFHVHVPGMRTRDVARMQRESVRRNGRRYANPVVHYARS